MPLPSSAVGPRVLRALLGAGVLAALAAAPACKSDGPTGNTNEVTSVLIVGGDQTVNALGAFRLQALGLNRDRVEVDPSTFVWHWSSLDQDVAQVDNGGNVTALRNGTARIVASAFSASDTVTLTVDQKATTVAFGADTIVLLTTSATAVAGTALTATDMTLVASAADANGNVVPGTAQITWSANGAPVTITPNANGDTVRVAATATGLGHISATVNGHTSQIVYQAVDRYGAVRISTPPAPGAPTQLSPNPITIPVGAAVVFVNADPNPEQPVDPTNHWFAGPIPGGLREAQVFTATGTYMYRVNSTSGTIVVQ